MRKYLVIALILVVLLVIGGCEGGVATTGRAISNWETLNLARVLTWLYEPVEQASPSPSAVACDKNANKKIESGEYCSGRTPVCMNEMEYESLLSDDCTTLIVQQTGLYLKRCVECSEESGENTCPAGEECCRYECYDPNTEQCCDDGTYCEYSEGDHNICPGTDNPKIRKECCNSGGGGGVDRCGGICDADGDGISESCYLCDDDQDGKKDTCRYCDYDGDGTPENCRDSDNNNDGVWDDCKKCNLDPTGIPQEGYGCDNNNDGVNDDCKHCDLYNSVDRIGIPDGFIDSCYNIDTDADGILDDCDDKCKTNIDCINYDRCVEGVCNIDTGECEDQIVPDGKFCGLNRVCCDQICCSGGDTCDIEPYLHCSSEIVPNPTPDCIEPNDCGNPPPHNPYCSWDMESLITEDCIEGYCIPSEEDCPNGCGDIYTGHTLRSRCIEASPTPTIYPS